MHGIQSQYEYMTALKFVRPKSDVWQPQVTNCSAVTGDNIDQVWNTMHGYWKLMEVRPQPLPLRSFSNI